MVSAQSADMVRVSFDLQQEELVYYYRAFIAMSQRAIWHDVDDDTRERTGHLRCPVIEKQKLNSVSSAGVA